MYKSSVYSPTNLKQSCLFANWRGYTILKITNRHNFHAEVWDKIINGKNNLILEAGSTGSDKKEFIKYNMYCLFSDLRAP